MSRGNINGAARGVEAIGGQFAPLIEAALLPGMVFLLVVGDGRFANVSSNGDPWALAPALREIAAWMEARSDTPP